MATSENDEPREALPQEIHVAGGYGGNTKRPFVSLRIKDVAVHLSVEEARDVARSLVQVAESAVGDGFLVEYFVDKFDLSINQAGALLVEFRIWRANHREGAI